MKDAKLEFNPIIRAESLMAQETFRQNGDGSQTAYVTPERREQMRDLMMLSIAKSLSLLADAICGDPQNTGIHKAILDLSDAIGKQ